MVALQTISILNLTLIVVPVVIVAVIYFRWAMHYQTILYAFSRMAVQLILIGYVLSYLFEWNNATTMVVVFAVMLSISGWIALYPLKHKGAALYVKLLFAIAVGGLTTLAFLTQAVLELSPWFSVKYMIPLGGIAFSNAMNTVSLAAERFESETATGRDYEAARNTAFHASMIPTINMLFAVGLVSLPGVMSGQILSGVSPLVAVRYQMVIMCLVLGASGISVAVYLALMRPSLRKERRSQSSEAKGERKVPDKQDA